MIFVSLGDEFYTFIIAILVSFICGFLIGIERTRTEAQYGARDHIFFSMTSTALIILLENFLPIGGIAIVTLFFAGMIAYLLIGTVYRLFKTDNPGYTSTLAMILAMVVGIMSYYNYYVAIALSVIFLIVLSTKNQFKNIRKLEEIEWAASVEFIAIVALLFILFPDDIILANINIKSIVIIFITILVIKYFSYFLLKSSTENNLYYISFLGGFAHSEATTMELSKTGASSSAIWLVIQPMLLRILLILAIAPLLLLYALIPIISTAGVGLVGSFIILRKKNTSLDLEKVKNPLSIKSALIFSGTYFIAVAATVFLGIFPMNFITYSIVAIVLGFLSGGASSMFTTTAYIGGLITIPEALLLLCYGLTTAILNKIFYSLRSLHEKKVKKRYISHLMTYLGITIALLITMTIFTLFFFGL